MARYSDDLTRAQASDAPDGWLNDNQLLGILASATNPDGTPYALPTTRAGTVAADVLSGRQAFTATTVATTIVTVPAGRTWVGQVGASVAVGVNSASTTAGQASALLSVAGAGAIPAAGVYLGVDALAGANAVTGLTGAQGSNYAAATWTVVAPAGNAVTIQVTATCAGTTSKVDAYATGVLVAN